MEDIEAQLKREAVSYDEAINGPASCYGTSDVRMYECILAELEKRGVDITYKLTF